MSFLSLLGLSEILLFLVPLLGVAPPIGVTLPNAAPPDPAAEAARFETVSKQLDPGGVLYGYVSVDGDLTAIGGSVNSFYDELRKVEPDVPTINVPALLKITGLDAVSAVGFSSKRIGDGFRNKAYVHVPNGRKGLLRILGGESKPFDVVKLAPAGTDIAIEQDLNLKVVYEASLEAMGVVVGEEAKAMFQGHFKQPMPPFPFTLEKILTDMDTQVTIIIDADPAKMVAVPDAKGLQIPQMNGAVLIDGLGWIADDVVKAFEPMLAQGAPGAPPFKVIKDANWVGMQLSMEAASFERIYGDEARQLRMLGGQSPLLVHHRPSGNLILATGKEFADKLFSPKPGLAEDPVFQKTMQGLPMEGTGLSYFSPDTFRILREALEKLNDLENDKEHERGDRLVGTTLINLFLPKNARGEGSVTTNTKEGMLTVSNSAHSQKSTLLMGGVAPLALIFSGGREVEAPRALQDHDHDGHIHAPNIRIDPDDQRPDRDNFEKDGD
jgi:hypothetical protein